VQVVDWRELVENGNFAAAEEAMRNETEAMDQYGENTVTRAAFYESWGDALGSGGEAAEKYTESVRYWSLFASWSTSGGEGTARMMDVNRVLKKIENVSGR
jgi:hypothetical protein